MIGHSHCGGLTLIYHCRTVQLHSAVMLASENSTNLRVQSSRAAFVLTDPLLVVPER